MKWQNVSSKDYGATPTSYSRQTKLGLLEKHTRACNCSYCLEFHPKAPGIYHTSPGSKRWNSWWRWVLKTRKHIYYLRYHSIFYRKRAV